MRNKKKKWTTLAAAVAAAVAITGCAPAFVTDAVEAAKDKVKDTVEDQAGEILDGIKDKIGDKDKKEEKREDKNSSDDPEKKEDDSDEGGSEEGRSEKDGPDADESHSEGGGSEEGDLYDAYIADVLERELGKAKDETFSYRYQRRDGYNGYWFSVAETAPLSDSLIGTSRCDLDLDGQDELLVCRMEGSQGTGSGHNGLRVDAYDIAGDEVTKIGSIQFPECFETYNSEEYLVGVKTVGQNVWIYAYDNSFVWSWADGVNPRIRLYQYDGSYLKEQYKEACSGSDDSWWGEWDRDLRSYGFDLRESLGQNPCLTGESNFQVILYGQSTTIVDRQAMYRSYEVVNGKTVDRTQDYILEHGVIQGNICGEDSQTVCRMNQGERVRKDPWGETGSQPAQNYGDDDYIIPDSSSRYLSLTDLRGLSKDQLRLARNEIYARHGRKFQSQELQDYFNAKSWYRGTIEPDQFNEKMLNSYEKENIKLIKSMEE